MTYSQTSLTAMLTLLIVLLVGNLAPPVVSFQESIPSETILKTYVPQMPDKQSLSLKQESKVHSVEHLDLPKDLENAERDEVFLGLLSEWRAKVDKVPSILDIFVERKPEFDNFVPPTPTPEADPGTQAKTKIFKEVGSKTQNHPVAASQAKPGSKTLFLVLLYVVGVLGGAVGFVLFLICFWCFLVGVSGRAQNDYYAPQTFKQQGSFGGSALFQPMDRPWGAGNNKLEGYQRGLFTPAGRDGTPQSTSQTWTPDNKETWRGSLLTNTKPEPWRLPYALSKEQQATILHHKQALTSEGAFRFEYASDNGLAAGEQIEPDGSRVGAYQYKDPSGQLVKLKYRAGKDGFQILEGSHLPKSPEPVAPQTQDNHYQSAYAQQRQQYELQQQYNQQRPEQNSWRDEQGAEGQKAAGGQYFVQNSNWRPQGGEDDGQYRENEVENKGPHSFGEGYAFAFKG